MRFSQLITRRYSVRNYKSMPVESEKLEQVLEAARLAPSAVNFQPWHFIVVTQPENLAKIHLTYHREWFRTAPVIIIACADHSLSWKRNIDGKDSAEIDVAIAVDHITLQAADLGLGTCWVCNFDTQRCAEALKLPGHIEPIAMIPLGYPESEEIPKKRRKLLEEIIHWEKF
jgi:nitroreductase